MSTPSPQGPQGRPVRRRIAGERRPARPDEAVPPSAEPPEPAQETEPTEPAQETRPPEPAQEAGPPEASSGRARSGPSGLVVGLLGGLALVLVLASVYFGLIRWSYTDVRTADRVAEASRTAPPVAERAAATILSYDYRSLDADEKAAERYLTPSFRKQYVKSMGLVRPNAPKLRAKVVASVKASGVSHADPDRVDVLVYVDQTTTSTANGGQPQLALNRALFSMVRTHGTWLVDKITSY